MRRFALFVLATFAIAACAGPEKADDSPPTETTEETVDAVEGEAKTSGEESGVVPDVVATSKDQWTGVAVVESGAIYVNFPRWSETIPMSVARLEEGTPVPFPGPEWNDWEPGANLDSNFVSVQSVVSDGEFIWVLDTGNPGFQGVIDGAPRLFKFNEAGEKLREIGFEGAAKLNTYLNDVRFSPDGKRAYITDSGIGGLIVVDLEEGKSYRVLDDHPSTKAQDVVVTIDGEKWLRGGEPPKIHADGIAIHDGTLYYQALSGRTLYRIETVLLEERIRPEARARGVEEVALVGPSDGLIAGPDGAIYLSSLEENAVRVWRPDGAIEVVSKSDLIAWPDSFSFGPDGTLYVTTSRIHQTPNPPAPYGLLKVAVE